MTIGAAFRTTFVVLMLSLGLLAAPHSAEVERVLAEAPGVRLPVPGDQVSLPGDTSLTTSLWHIQERTGYQFRTMGFHDPEIAERQIGVDVDGPVKRVLEEICALAGCSCRRVYPTAFSVSSYDPGPDDAPMAEVGDYRVRVRSLAFSLGTHRFGTPVMRKVASYRAGPRMTIEFEIDAPDSDTAACILGLGDALRIVTDEGDELAPVDDKSVARANSGMNSYPDPTTPSLRLDVALPPASVRTLSIEAELALWSGCKRVDASLPWGKVGETASGAGVEITTMEFGETPDGMLTCALRVSKPRPEAPDTPGIPWVRDIRHETQARLIWTAETFALATPDIGIGDLWRFSFTRPGGPRGLPLGAGGPAVAQPEKVEGPPQGIVIWTYVKADPSARLPFKISGVPVPDLSDLAAASLPEGPAPPAALTGPGVGLTAPDQFTRPGAIEFDVLIDGKTFVTHHDILLIVMMVKLDEDEGSGKPGQARLALAEPQEDGRYKIAALKPGSYQLLVRADTMPLRALTRETYGIDPGEYTWANAVAYAEVKPGEITVIDPIRFVPKVHPLSPRSGDVVARDNVAFAWEPHPDAAVYRVSLGMWETRKPPSTFWVSDAVEGTEVVYDPQKGHVQREVDRHYKLEPGISYYWWVSAIDGQGKTITRAHGGGFFQVK